jgi:hypothetical protein
LKCTAVRHNTTDFATNNNINNNNNNNNNNDVVLQMFAEVKSDFSLLNKFFYV